MQAPAAAERGVDFRVFPLALHDLLSRVDRLSGVRDVLRLYVDHFGLFGAALWEVAQNTSPASDERLFIQAQYFDGSEQPPFYQLPADSISARCIRSSRPARHSRVKGVWDADIPVSHPNSLDDLEITAFASIPIKLRTDSDLGTDSTLTFYRCLNPFGDTEYSDLQDAARLFPAVYRAIHERASLALLKQVQVDLRNLHFPSTEVDASAAAQQAIDRVLETIEQHFQFLEISIYLHDPAIDPPDRFTRMAGRWPWETPYAQHCYAGDVGIAQVLRTGRQLRFLDIASAGQSPEGFRHLYGAEGPLDIRRAVQKSLKLPEGAGFPLSYACVPVRKGREVAGALRCCISRSGPYHIDEDIIQVLALVAEMIADWWDHWTREERESYERIAASSTMGSLGFANRFAVDHLREERTTVKLMEHLLLVCRRSVPQADVVEVWLREEPGGPLVRQTGQRSVARLDDLPGRPQGNAFHYVMTTSTVLHQKKARDPRTPYLPPVGADFFSFTVAPVVLESAPAGVLLLATSRDSPWPESISNSARFLADQLALYIAFQRQVQALKDVKDKLERSVRDQGELLLDFQHQIRTPVNIARNSCEQLSRSEPSRPEWKPTMSALTSSVRRAGVVANNLDIFVRLAQGRPVVARMARLEPEAVLEGIQQASEFLYNKGALAKSLQFDIRRAREYAAPVPAFLGDSSLIELIADNLLDNAVKYSFADTIVVVEVGAALYGREVYFSFRNQGLPILSADAAHLAERRFRGVEAQLTSPEGTGIGLWMVSEVMKSMKGRLQVFPTDGDRWNEFRICFRGKPDEKRSGH